MGSLQLFLVGLCTPKFCFSTPKTKCLKERNALGEHNLASRFLGCRQPRFIPCTADAHENPNPWAASFLNIELQSLILPQKPPRFNFFWLLQVIFLQFSGISLCSSTILETLIVFFPQLKSKLRKGRSKGNVDHAGGELQDLLRHKKEQQSQKGLPETQKSFELP